MKYVMFTHGKTGLKLPVFCGDHFTHSDMRAGKSWTPTSAGFFNLRDFSVHGKSDSLQLEAGTDDAEICKLTLAGMESIIYLAQDTKANLVNLRNIRKARRKLKDVAPLPQT